MKENISNNINQHSHLQTPVLFLVFNRLDTTKQVFETIRHARPLKLYVAADGPRDNKVGEAQKVEAVREYILTHIDWDCEVKTLFREKNLGCKYAVSGAITWFFKHVEEGIILEDDCLPHSSFFPFCAELLERFRDNDQVFMISGRNDLGSWKSNLYSYFFTTGNMWGWASWRRAWDHYDLELKHWDDEIAQQNMREFERKAPCIIKSVTNGCQAVLKRNLDTWDYQWAFTRIAHRAIGVIPAVNLIANIGFGKDGTHTFQGNSPYASTPVYAMQFPLKHNPDMCIDFDYFKKRHKLNQGSLLSRIKGQIKGFCRKSLNYVSLRGIYET